MNKDKKPLSKTHPDLAKEADGWDPKTVVAGTNKKLAWKCKLGHKYEATGDSRTLKKTGCPVCSNQKVLAGFNDLATTHPELAKEANGWDPTKVIAGTIKRLEWKCKRGHVWISTGNSRVTKNNTCTFCANKKVLAGFNDLASNYPEVAKEAYGWDPTTVIAGTHKKLKWKCSIGHIWSSRGDKRTARNQKCPVCSNQKVLAGFNDLATTHPELAKEANGWDPTKVIAGAHKKLKWKCQVGHKYQSPSVNRAFGKSGCPVCSNQKVLAGFNDLATTHPELAKEANGWDPKKITAGSDTKRNWKCAKGHKWNAQINSRHRNGCPTCSNKKVQRGFNDLATTHPEIANEADGWNPRTVSYGVGKRLKWKCDKGHSWKTTVNSRSTGSGCPTCAIGHYDPNQNAYLYFLIHTTWELFQIGITNSPKKRIADHEKLGWKVLTIRGPMDGHTTQELETALLRYLKSQNAHLSPEHVAGKFDGYTESWTIDSYKVNNLKELIDKASEAGF